MMRIAKEKGQRSVVNDFSIIHEVYHDVHVLYKDQTKQMHLRPSNPDADVTITRN